MKMILRPVTLAWTLLIIPMFIQLALSQRKPSQAFCTMMNLQQCMTFLNFNDSALPTSVEELTKVCDELRSGVKCIDRHTRECFSQEQKMVFKDLVTPAKEFISQLCEEGETQTEFLRHAKCYRNISMDAEKCAVKYKTAVSTSSNATQAHNTELSMKQSCCALREFVHCKYLHVGQDCGVRAEDFMKNHLGQITNPIMERHCTAYTYGSEACLSLVQSEVKNTANTCHFNNTIMLIIMSYYLSFRLITSHSVAYSR